MARTPRAMTDGEVRRVMATLKHEPRNAALVALALGTGLRQAELVALNCGDVFKADGRVRTRIRLQWWKGKDAGRGLSKHEVFVSDALRKRLAKLRTHKSKAGESLEPDAPLFVSRNRNRLSVGRCRNMWREIQRRADLDRRFTFHELRHTAITRVYRATGDLRLSQKFARHSSPETTAIYAHVADEALAAVVETVGV